MKSLKESTVIIIVYVIIILAAVLALSSCSPVKRVLLNEKYYKQVTDKFVLDGGCVNDTIFQSDTTVLLDTLYSLDYKTDTVTIDNIKTVVKTEYKTVTKTVTIKDTAIVRDYKKEDLLNTRIYFLEGEKEGLKSQIANCEQETKEWKGLAKKRWWLMWLVIVLCGVWAFRRPLLKLATMKIPFKLKL